MPNTLPDDTTSPPDLVGDIGGTNTRLALADGGVLRPGSLRRFLNRDHAALDTLLRAYLRETATPVCSGVCLAVAGPVRDNAVRMTNLPWRIDSQDLATLAGTRRVALLNDLQAQGHALPALTGEQLCPVLPGLAPVKGARRLVVGLGTGVNAVVVHDLGRRALVPPSEAGHVDLPQRDDEARALARHLVSVSGWASVEEALAGRGLSALDSFVGGGGRTSQEVIAALEAGEEAAQAVGRLYAQILGQYLANLALLHMPLGGVYLIGGLARAMAPHLPRLGLAEALRAQCRVPDLADRIAVWLIDEDFAALNGCAAFIARRR